MAMLVCLSATLDAKQSSSTGITGVRQPNTSQDELVTMASVCLKVGFFRACLQRNLWWFYKDMTQMPLGNDRSQCLLPLRACNPP
eukprot:scaffold990_cov393-Prasinococcus_capsulatus_cf.AAC.37